MYRTRPIHLTWCSRHVIIAMFRPPHLHPGRQAATGIREDHGQAVRDDQQCSPARGFPRWPGTPAGTARLVPAVPALARASAFRLRSRRDAPGHDTRPPRAARLGITELDGVPRVRPRARASWFRQIATRPRRGSPDHVPQGAGAVPIDLPRPHPRLARRRGIVTLPLFGTLGCPVATI